MRLLIYDGECDFCCRSARWIETRLGTQAQVTPWQDSDLAALGLSVEQASSAVWWIESSGHKVARYSGADAVGRALIASGGRWRLIGLLMIRRPILWIARAVYRFVAANRHRLGAR